MEIDPSWRPVIHYLYSDKLLELREKILPNISYFPPRDKIFNALSTDIKSLKVVILGQDPYPTPNTAIGYSFAVESSHSIPPSLRIIKNELSESFPESNFEYKEFRTLKHWVYQGVLLLNTALTVEAGKAGSHLKYWDDFTKATIRYLSATNPCIWLLWGKKAQEFKSCIYSPFEVKGYKEDTIKSIPALYDRNYVLEAPHPAASLYGGNQTFIGCNHFKFTNEILKVKKEKQINW